MFSPTAANFRPFDDVSFVHRGYYLHGLTFDGLEHLGVWCGEGESSTLVEKHMALKKTGVLNRHRMNYYGVSLMMTYHYSWFRFIMSISAETSRASFTKNLTVAKDGHRPLKYIHAWVWLESLVQTSRSSSLFKIRNSSKTEMFWNSKSRPKIHWKTLLVWSFLGNPRVKSADRCFG